MTDTPVGPAASPPAAGVLTFSINVTVDGCVDHREGIADDATHAYFTQLLAAHSALLYGRDTYELMEAYWPAVARGEVDAPPAMREWAATLEAIPKYVVSSTRTSFPWHNSHHLSGEVRESVARLKAQHPGGVIVGSGRLATALDRLGLVDEYRLLLQPMLTGHGPTLYGDGLPATRRLDLVSAHPFPNGTVALHYRRSPATG